MRIIYLQPGFVEVVYQCHIVHAVETKTRRFEINVLYALNIVQKCSSIFSDPKVLNGPLGQSFHKLPWISSKMND